MVVGSREPLIKQTGDCKIEVSSKQRHACTWDVLRATIDVLLGTCLDGPQAVGLGGIASARPFDANDPTSLLRRNSFDHQNITELGAGPPLPSTFEIEISKARPLPPLCHGSTEPVNGTAGCIGHSLTNSTSGNGSLLLISNRTGAFASLLPVAINPDVTS